MGPKSSARQPRQHQWRRAICTTACSLGLQGSQVHVASVRTGVGKFLRSAAPCSPAAASDRKRSAIAARVLSVLESSATCRHEICTLRTTDSDAGNQFWRAGRQRAQPVDAASRSRVQMADVVRAVVMAVVVLTHRDVITPTLALHRAQDAPETGAALQRVRC